MLRRIGFVVLLLGSAAWAQEERMLSFHSDIQVRPDSSMQVRETIVVHSEGREIRHGIYRDFPTSYRDRFHNRVTVDFTILGVTRDGNPEPYHTQDRSNGVRVYFGSKDVNVPAGDHSYTFTYETRRQLGYFQDHDELYWNVTGNGWIFPIEQASATVTLPPGVPRSAIRTEAYTGAQGERGTVYHTQIDEEGRAVFETTAPLMAREGLTIVVGWPKGFVTPPTTQQELEYFFRDNRSTLVGLLGLVAVTFYYVLVWAKVGKDPEPGSIMPIYDAPQGLSPAAMRYLVEMGYDDRVFAANVINLAVKGYLEIKEKGSKYSLGKKGGSKVPLSADEKLTYDKLLGSRSEVDLDQSERLVVKGAVDGLRTSLKNSEEKIYFVANGQWLVPGIVLSILVVLAMVLSLRKVEAVAMSAFMSVWLTIWSLGVFTLLKQVTVMWRAALAGGIGLKASAMFLTLFSLPFVGGEIVGLVMLAVATSVFTVLILAALVFLAILFHHLLKAPTSAGRALLDKVEGFKMFLSAVEKDRLNVLNPLPRTPATFEKYLPYALALGVEQQWSEQFADVLAQAGREVGGAGYSPAWYHGTNWSSFGPSGFGTALGNAMSGAIAASASAPGSSSGFSGGGGGGGSSGGGGGGGGGGGW